MKKTASSPEQDLHPDWDRFRGTMLYPLSCGELAMNGEKILRWYETSEARAARKNKQRFCGRSVLTLKWHFNKNFVVWFIYVQIQRRSWN